MIISDLIGFDGIAAQTPSEQEMLVRLEAFRGQVLRQLNAQPTVFYADPDNEPEKIEGNKEGDLAIWVDATGTSQFRVLT